MYWTQINSCSASVIHITSNNLKLSLCLRYFKSQRGAQICLTGTSWQGKHCYALKTHASTLVSNVQQPKPVVDYLHGCTNEWNPIDKLQARMPDAMKMSHPYDVQEEDAGDVMYFSRLCLQQFMDLAFLIFPIVQQRTPEVHSCTSYLAQSPCR